MRRSKPIIDVRAVRTVSDRVNVGFKVGKKQRRQTGRRSVSAVQTDVQPFECIVDCLLQIRQIFLRTFIIVVDRDRKSTRLNSSHVKISYAVFYFKKKKL